MKHMTLKSSLPYVLIAGILAGFSGCINVKKEVTPAATTTETTHAIAPAATTKVDRSTSLKSANDYDKIQ
jgi:hypothetical protein